MRGWILGALAALAFADAAKAADLPARQSNRNPNSTHVTPPAVVHPSCTVGLCEVAA
jgi:hypothetical protein